MNAIFRPHDLLFKTQMANIEIAQDFLQAHLPEALTVQCEWSTLRLESGSFVSPSMREHLSDILYSVKAGDAAAYVYVLVEHQSAPHQLMPFRILEYVLAAMRRHIDQKRGKKLLIVVPLLFYQDSNSPYPFSLDLMDCFENPELARQFFPGPLFLVDLTATPDEKLLTHRRAAAFEMVMKHVKTRDIYLLLKDVLQLLLAYSTPIDKGLSILQYLMQEGECRDNEKFFSYVIEHAPEYGDKIMTLAQQLEQKGRQEGRQEVAVNLLEDGLLIEQVARVTRLSQADIIELAEGLKLNKKLPYIKRALYE